MVFKGGNSAELCLDVITHPKKVEMLILKIYEGEQETHQ